MARPGIARAATLVARGLHLSLTTLRQNGKTFGRWRRHTLNQGRAGGRCCVCHRRMEGRAAFTGENVQLTHAQFFMSAYRLTADWQYVSAVLQELITLTDWLAVSTTRQRHHWLFTRGRLPPLFWCAVLYQFCTAVRKPRANNDTERICSIINNEHQWMPISVNYSRAETLVLLDRSRDVSFSNYARCSITKSLAINQSYKLLSMWLIALLCYLFYILF